VEIFNKTIKNATTKIYHYETVDELKQHLMSYLLYYNHQKKLKALKFKTPYTILLEKFDSSPELFKENPYLKFRGLNRIVIPHHSGDTLHPKIIKELLKAIEDYVFAANTGFAHIST